MQNFDFKTNTRIIFAPGAIARLGELVTELGGKKVLLVSDPGIVAAGHVEKALHSFSSLTKVTLFTDVRENPTTDIVNKGTKVAKEHQIDFIVGLGGGSSMDCAKGINFLYTNGGQMSDYWGFGKAKKAMLPSIGIPTTGGTGSESQCYSLISDEKTHNKMACGDKKAAFKVAILDPQLTVSQPEFVTIVTGLDAISHALETAVTKRVNPISKMFSFEAWPLLIHNFSRVLENGDDLEARAAMQLGASYAGLAIENSMLGAAHSCANPLTKNFNIVHGQAVATMLPHIVRFNGEEVGDTYYQLCQRAGWEVKKEEAAQLLASKLIEVLEIAQIPQKLAQSGIPKEKLSILAKEASQQWTAQFNPRKAVEEDFLKLYENAF